MTTSNIARTLHQSGVLLIGGALLSAEVAGLHMRELAQTYGVICGLGFGVVAHCPACYASALLFAAGVVALVLAQTDRPAVRRVMSSRSG